MSAEVQVRGVVAPAAGEPGGVVVEAELPHGADPAALLLSRGWSPEGPIAATRTDAGSLRLDYLVAAQPVTPVPLAQPEPRLDEGLTAPDVAEAVRYRRVAAYALVVSDRGVLLTELSDRTSAPGWWNLPGGGLDPGEAPEDGVRREVWEETGQRVQVRRLRGVGAAHWIGRAPGGHVEDFQAIRVIYEAGCEHPTDPVVHDVGGTTASAAWVPLGAARAGAVPVVQSFAALVEAL